MLSSEDSHVRVEDRRMFAHGSSKEDHFAGTFRTPPRHNSFAVPLATSTPRVDMTSSSYRKRCANRVSTIVTASECATGSARNEREKNRIRLLNRGFEALRHAVDTRAVPLPLASQLQRSTRGGSGVGEFFEEEEQQPLWDTEASEDSGIRFESNNNTSSISAIALSNSAATEGRRIACAERLSKADTLRDAIHYIRQLEQLLK